MKKLLLIITTLLVCNWAIAQIANNSEKKSPPPKKVTEAVATKNVKIYPNPVTNGEFTVKGDEGTTIKKITIMNVIGQVKEPADIYNESESQTKISIPDFKKGIYFVKVTFAGQSKKSIIKKLLVK